MENLTTLQIAFLTTIIIVVAVCIIAMAIKIYDLAGENKSKKGIIESQQKCLAANKQLIENYEKIEKNLNHINQLNQGVLGYFNVMMTAIDKFNLPATANLFCLIGSYFCSNVTKLDRIKIKPDGTTSSYKRLRKSVNVDLGFGVFTDITHVRYDKYPNNMVEIFLENDDYSCNLDDVKTTSLWKIYNALKDSEENE